MEISHFSNSFIVVESSKGKVCCDPWVGAGNYGGWHSFPEYNIDDLRAFLSDTDIVYISHLHEDHFDPRFLKSSDLISKKFLIKNFEIKTLYQRLKSIGVTDITEIESFDIFEYNGLRMSIIPQMTSNSSELEDEINYDLDTSIIIGDGDVTYFNQVDNPLSIEDYKYLSDWISENYGPLTVVSLMSGAASEFPQAFFNIDRETEKNSILQSSFIKLKKRFEILKPKHYFPAGGTYFIPGKLFKLNSFIAQPSFEEITNYFKKEDINVVASFLEGGKALVINNNDVNNYKIIEKVKPVSTTIESSINNHKDDRYNHELDEYPNFDIVKKIFKSAEKQWLKTIREKNIFISQNIYFVIYSNLTLNDKVAPNNDNILDTIKLNQDEDYSFGALKIHIDINAFYRCLIRKQVWNGTIGALCMFERSPNIFYPTDTFSLNYLVASKEDVAAIIGN